MEKRDEVLRILSLRLRKLITLVEMDFERLQEVRLRIGKPLILIYDNGEYFVNQNAKMCSERENAFVVTQSELKETMEYISNYSLYAFEDELRQGFLTIQGGHRVGVVGKAIIEDERIKNIRYISGINIRLSHQIKGCATKVLPYLVDRHSVFHTLIISPPSCGKTTLLRDVIRQLSNGTNGRRGRTIGVVDERSELGACYMGVPQNDLGIRTDVLDCCPKAVGMLMLIRSMSPEIIAVDEIGREDDIESIEYAIHCGCILMATVHGSSMEDVSDKPFLGDLVKRKVFKRYVILNNRGRIGNLAEIYDERGNALYQNDKNGRNRVRLDTP